MGGDGGGSPPIGEIFAVSPPTKRLSPPIVQVYEEEVSRGARKILRFSRLASEIIADFFTQLAFEMSYNLFISFCLQIYCHKNLLLCKYDILPHREEGPPPCPPPYEVYRLAPPPTKVPDGGGDGCPPPPFFWIWETLHTDTLARSHSHEHTHTLTYSP